MKRYIYSMLFAFISITAFSQNFVCQPYFGTNTIRFYDKTNPTAASPFYALDLSNDVWTAFRSSNKGLNDVLIYNNKLFASFDLNGQGGILIYNLSDIYPTRTANAPTILKPGGSPGNASAGMAINPINGDLYVATFHGLPNDGGVYTYTATSNYDLGSQFLSRNNDNSVASICANLAFDASSNLWMTTFDWSTASNSHFLICYKATSGIPNKNNFYKITNTASASYSATDASGVVHNSLHLLSAPEGIAFDPAGNLWIGNNNDDGANVNPTGSGTFVEITAAGIAALLSNTANGSSFTIPAANTSIKYIAGAKLGGMVFDATTVFLNDQGQNQGTNYASSGTVWKWNVSTAFNNSNFLASGIHTTFPGNGQAAMVPCSLTTPANPTSASASPSSVVSGGTTVLSASGCAAGATYQWKNGSTQVSTNASFTSPALSSPTNYTAYCANGICLSTGVAVNVSIGSCTPPSVPVLGASPATVTVGAAVLLTATGCNSPNIVVWSNSLGNGTSKVVYPTATTTYTATCSNGTCASGNGSVAVTVYSTALPSPSLVGYLHNWDDASNGLPYVQLDAVPAAYTVINYAFGLAQAGTTDNIQLNLAANVDANPATRTNTFIQKMNFVQNQGRKVLLSLGGENGYLYGTSTPNGGGISVETTAKRDNFIASVTNILKTYPFDGLDIDIEAGVVSTFVFNQAGMTVQNPNSPSINNFIYAIKQIMLNYRGIRGKKMLLTFAPESFHVTGGFSDYGYANESSNAAYLPIIEALKDSLDLVHTQLYTGGSDIGKDTHEYCGGTQGGAMAITEDLMLGYTLNHSQGIFSGLPSSKIALGFASPCAASAAGRFLTTSEIQGVVKYFRGTGSQPVASSIINCSSWMSSQPAYTKISAGAVEFRGLMTWSINYDVNVSCSNNSFANNYLDLYGAFTQSANAKNFLTFTIPSQVGSSVINTSSNTITVTMPAGTNLSNLTPTFTTSPNTLTAKLSGVTAGFYIGNSIYSNSSR